MNSLAAEDTDPHAHWEQIEYVAASIGDQSFGIPIGRIHDVFVAKDITPVPLADPEIAGILNLRGKIVTAIDMRKRLELPPRTAPGKNLALGIEYKREAFCLMIDALGDVLTLSETDREPNPTNLHPAWAEVSDGVFRLKHQLLVVLDVQKILNADTQI